MIRAAVVQLFNGGQPVTVDRWLRFPPAIDAYYERECGSTRQSELCAAIYLGLALYNLCNLTSITLLPDILGASVALRLGLVTPVSLALVWAVKRVRPRRADRLALAGAFNAFMVPILLFWLSHAPRSLFTFAELPLTIIFANVVLALRFRHAAGFTAGALVLTLLALCAKGGIDASLRCALAVQIVTACSMSLYANYRTERRRCGEYLTTLNATLQAEQAEAARRQFQDLSRIDALTELPNRRYLMERLDEWYAKPLSIALMMVDVDHFKLYNDSLGHPAGDECLRRLARALAAACCNADAFVARFGGEEFTVILRAASELEATLMARTLVQSIAALGLPHPAVVGGLGFVTASVGVAFRPAGATLSKPDLFSAADRALYLAKQSGRNCFALAEKDREAVALRA